MGTWGTGPFDSDLACLTKEKSSVPRALTWALNSFQRSWDRGNAH